MLLHPHTHACHHSLELVLEVGRGAWPRREGEQRQTSRLAKALGDSGAHAARRDGLLSHVDALGADRHAGRECLPGAPDLRLDRVRDDLLAGGLILFEPDAATNTIDQIA